jgi:hypothetical protein
MDNMIDSDEQEEYLALFPHKSDLEKFIELYKSVGIEFGHGISEGDGAKIGYQYLNISLPYLNPQDYIDYHQCLYFDESGKFIQQGIWE